MSLKSELESESEEAVQHLTEKKKELHIKLRDRYRILTIWAQAFTTDSGLKLK